MSVENSFKQTEIGLIPEDWEVVRLGEVITYKKGKKPKRLFKVWESEYLPYLTADYFRTGKPSQFVDVKKEMDIEIVNHEDVVLIWDGSKAGDTFTGLEGVLASTMVKINVKDTSRIDKKLVYYFLTTKFEILNSKTTGSTIPHVNKTVFENLLIPLPPLEEQRKIAKVLDKIQQAIEVQDKIIQQVKNLKKSLLQRLFTEGLYGEERKETEIGLIPKSWEVVRLGEVFNIFAGGDISKLNWSPEKNDKFIYPIYSNSLENDGLYGFADTFKFQNAITVTGRGNVGYAVPRYEKFNAIIRLLVLVPKVTLNIKFVAEFINKFIKVNFEGSSIPQLTRPKIATFLIPLPPLEEQNQIAYILSTIDKKIEVEQKRKEILKELFKTMLHKLMSGEIRLKDVEI
jgi:type I restriction enzyme S subunit